MENIPKRYERCAHCKRLIKSGKVILVNSKPHGETCAKIALGLIRQKSRRKQLGVPRFNFDGV